jgi:hypothetical protein
MITVSMDTVEGRMDVVDVRIGDKPAKKFVPGDAKYPRAHVRKILEIAVVLDQQGNAGGACIRLPDGTLWCP